MQVGMGPFTAHVAFGAVLADFPVLFLAQERTGKPQTHGQGITVVAAGQEESLGHALPAHEALQTVFYLHFVCKNTKKTLIFKKIF